MTTIKTLLVTLFRGSAPRPRTRGGPMCEMLEHRELLSNVPFGPMMAGGADLGVTAAAGASVSAHVYRFDGKRGPGGLHAQGGDFVFTGKPGAGKLASLSPQLKADFATLQNDTKQLQSEVPAAVTAQLTADKAVIAKAFGSLALFKHRGGSMMGQTSTSGTVSSSQVKGDGEVHDHGIMISTLAPAPGTNPSANMTAMLEKAGVSAAQATQVATDFQNYQTTLSTLDPTLHAKITADQAAITKDGGPSLSSGKAGGVVFSGPMI